ncbi:nitroreductase family protein [Streptomyces hydrogenans]
MDVTTALLTRRGERDLACPAPAPGREVFAYLLKVAAPAPTTACCTRGAASSYTRRGPRETRGLPHRGSPLDRRSQAAAKTQCAPSSPPLVFAPVHGHKVPEWGQLAATSAMTRSLMLLLHARGYGSTWRTGPGVCPQVRRLLTLKDEEECLGSLSTGTANSDATRRRRPLSAVSDRRGWLSYGAKFAPDASTPPCNG